MNIHRWVQWTGLGLSILLLQACSGSGTKERQELGLLVSSRQFDKALEFVRTNAFFQGPKQQLLRFMELGSIHHAAGQYYQSILALEQAKELHQKMFTVSISKKAGTLITNDTTDNYYGVSYERSLLHFYLALNHYLIFQQGFHEAYTPEGGKEIIAQKVLTKDERRLQLQAARAEILAWDSYLDWVRKDKLGRSVFKNDLLAKTFGALIHEAMGSREDTQTAMLLYREAKTVLFRNYNAYKTFNQNFVKFKQDYAKLPGLDAAKVEQEYVKATRFQEQLKNYLDYKILQLTKNFRPNEYKQMLLEHKPSVKVLEMLKSEGGKSNVTILLQHGLIPRKIPSTQYYSLESALTPDNPSAAQKQMAQVGSSVIMLFAAHQLGLMPPPGNYNPMGWELGVRLGAAMGNHLAFAFELPVMENKEISDESIVQVLTGPDQKMLKQYHLPVINPLLDVAREAIAEDSASRYTRLGVRLGTKHLTAIMASFVTYNAMKEKAGEFFAKQAAAAQYILASKGIAASEVADTRYWSTLPADFRLMDFRLPKGSYGLRVLLKNDSDAAPRQVPAGNLVMDKDDQMMFHNVRI